MNAVVIERELREQLGQMPEHQQRQVLDFAKALAARKSDVASGQALIRFAGQIPRDDLVSIAEAIEEGCEHVDPDEW